MIGNSSIGEKSIGDTRNIPFFVATLRKIKWNINNTVSKSSAIKWTIFHFVIASRTISWQIWHYVIKLITIRWHLIDAWVRKIRNTSGDWTNKNKND